MFKDDVLVSVTNLKSADIKVTTVEYAVLRIGIGSWAMVVIIRIYQVNHQRCSAQVRGNDGRRTVKRVPFQLGNAATHRYHVQRA